jgi:hypothetical protein
MVYKLVGLRHIMLWVSTIISRRRKLTASILTLSLLNDLAIDMRHTMLGCSFHCIGSLLSLTWR